MAILTFDFEVPDEVAQTVVGLPSEDRIAYLTHVNAFAVATLLHANFATPDDYDDHVNEPVDMALVAEIIAAEEEANRFGTISLEDFIKLTEADDGPGMIERARARVASGETLGLDSGYFTKRKTV